MPLLASIGNCANSSVMEQIFAAKTAIVEITGLDRDALHIYVALITYFGCCLLFRWKASQWRTLIVVMLVCVAGEYFDIRHYLAKEWPINFSNNFHDLWNTMLIPMAVFAMARFTSIFENHSTILADENESSDQPEV